MKPRKTIKAIVDALASQRRRGEPALIVRIEPNLIQGAINALPDYRKVFAPVVPGLTDLSPIYEVYERVQQAEGSRHSVLLLVKCRTTQEFRVLYLAWKQLEQGDGECGLDRLRFCHE